MQIVEKHLVIGAGVIGVTIAYELQRRGKSVVIVDRDEPGRGASYGNMASIAVTEFMPASRPAIWRQMPKWLLDPEGPVRVRPSYLPKLVPWFIRFLAASRPSKLRELEAQGAALSGRVYEDLLPLLSATRMSDLLTEEGCLALYADENELTADRAHIEILERFGFAHRHLDRAEIQALEPAISDRISRAVLFPDNRSIRDPYKLVMGILGKFQELGGELVRGNVEAFEWNADRLTGVRLTDGRVVAVDTMTLAVGAFSARLSSTIGETIPLETERGYHTQIMSPGVSLRHSIIWPAKAFMVTPTAGGLRVGGTVEMAGLDAPPDYRRAKITTKRAREALPGLRIDGTTEWMGHRPALPDTVPMIGPSAKVSNLFYAIGHGHLGLTYAATTARIIGDLVTGAPPPLDAKPYRVDRF
ncbi:FAD-binding oxidoreductase [Rhizobium sp. KVB221]|uniref:FAD-binding oxidoreductase n=1 Tax=Rhizobium setariae TaxID=2801340 RepID=A0A937CR56_9HYPH|nr:FAD-binding oxidoreductase [Rhizobium setariae]MBL0373957.1 FAD-binding oxidoreductase [Rhizobium setariae]